MNYLKELNNNPWLQKKIFLSFLKKKEIYTNWIKAYKKGIWKNISYADYFYSVNPYNFFIAIYEKSDVNYDILQYNLQWIYYYYKLSSNYHELIIVIKWLKDSNYDLIRDIENFEVEDNVFIEALKK